MPPRTNNRILESEVDEWTTQGPARARATVASAVDGLASWWWSPGPGGREFLARPLSASALVDPILRFRLVFAPAPNAETGPWPDSALAATGPLRPV